MHRRAEHGAALLVTMLILIALALLGVTTLNAVMGDQQVSGYQTRGRVAFHAAEAGLSAAMANIDGVGTPTIPSASLGDAVIYPYGQPSYGPDPDAAPAVDDLGWRNASEMNIRTRGNGPRYIVQYWKLNVVGNAPGGSTSRVEAATGVLRGI